MSGCGHRRHLASLSAMYDQDRYMWPIWANSRLTLWIHWERIRRHPSTRISINWPVSTIGSVSDYDSIGNQEVAGSSPVLVMSFSFCASLLKGTYSLASFRLLSIGRLAQLVVCLTTISSGIRRLRVRAPCWSLFFRQATLGESRSVGARCFWTGKRCLSQLMPTINNQPNKI